MTNIFDTGKWQKHIQCKNKENNIEFFYYNRLPRIARINYKYREESLGYLMDKNFFLRPPMWVLESKENGYNIFKYKDEGYKICDVNTDTIDIVNIKPIDITEACGKQIISIIHEENYKWLNDPKSKRVISTIPRIFSEPSVVIFELIQNAFDTNATKVKIMLEEEQFQFFHNGDKFTEADVNSISFVNLSTKDKDKVGFMGIGFKAIFLASDQPEIHSSPFSFLFNNKIDGGFILPINIQKKMLDENYTTLIHAPLKNHEVYKSLNSSLSQQEDAGNVCISNKTFLHLVKEEGNKLKGITEIKSPYININIDKGFFDNTYIILSQRLDEEPSEIEQWLRLERKLMPDKDESIEFLEARDIKGSNLENEGWEESVSIVIKLIEKDKKFEPDLNLDGLINVYLPTKIKTGLKFDVQGNFLVNAARDALKNMDGSWNSRLFRQLSELSIDILLWCKRMSGDGQVLVSAFYDLIPDWEEVNLSKNIINEVKDNYVKRFMEEDLVPVESKDEWKIDYVKPNQSIIVDNEAFELFGKENLEKYTQKKVVLQSLSENAVETMVEYFNIHVWDINDSIEFLENNSCEDIYSGFQTLRKWNRQLTKLYSYLYKQLKRHQNKTICKLLEQCNIFPIAWDEENKNYKLQSYTEKLYRLHNEPSQINLAAFSNSISILHQSFDNYLRGREGNLEEGEKKDLEGAREFLDLIDIKRLEPRTIIKDFILPVFKDVESQDINIIIDYTAYICRYYKELKENEPIKIVILNEKGNYVKPSDLYLSENFLYIDIKNFFGLGHEELFVSSLYLKNKRVTVDNWREFLIKIGVWDKLCWYYSKESISSYTDEGRRLKKDCNLPDPKAQWSNTDFPGGSYLVLNTEFGDEVKERLDEIDSINSKLKKDSMRAFIVILSSNWENYYSKLIKKNINYYKYGQAVYDNTKPYEKMHNEFSDFYTYLTNESWVPVINENELKAPKQVMILNEETVTFAEEGAFICEDSISEAFANQLGFLLEPAQITALDRLQRIVNRNVKDVLKYKEIYNMIFNDINGDIDRQAEIKAFFEENKVIYASERFWTSKEIIYIPDDTIGAYLPNLSIIYPEFKEQFIDILGISESQSTIYHIMQLFSNYIWKTERTITDEFRSIILYGYRRLLNYLDNNGDEIFKNTLEGIRFKTEAKVYCRKIGWVSINSSNTIIYLDVAKFDKNTLDSDKIYIESHLSQLKRDTEDIMPLLRLLNILPASKSISEEYRYEGTAALYPYYELVKRNILNLIGVMVRILGQKDYDDGEKSKINSFIRNIKRIGSMEILIYNVNEINTVLKLNMNNEILFESRKYCFIKVINEVIYIYISDKIKIIYGSLIEELENHFKIWELPVIQKDLVSKLITHTTANIEDYYEESINHFLIENGFVQEQKSQNIGSGTIDEPSEEVIDSEEENGDKELESLVKDIERPGDREDTNNKESENEPSNEDKISYDNLVKPIDDKEITLVDVSDEEYDDFRDKDTGPHNTSGGTKIHAKNKHFGNEFSKEDGDRGEEIVLNMEKKRLVQIGLGGYVNKLNHISKKFAGNPWDIESFDQKDGAVVPIRIEVKSTTDMDNHTFPMSEAEIREALAENHTKGELFIYRVYGVRESNPNIKRFNFREFFIKKKLRIITKDVYVQISTKKQTIK